MTALALQPTLRYLISSRSVGASMTPKNFWAAFRTTSRGCHEWRRGTNQDGYGTVYTVGLLSGMPRTALTHRVVWTLLYGPIPEGLKICHTCDNPPCGNPKHLFRGTQADNMADAVAKGRTARGEDASRAKLTWEQVGEIRRRLTTDEPTASIAAAFGVAKVTIYEVARQNTWIVPGAAPIKRPERASRVNKAQKLTSDQVVEMRRRIAGGETQQAVATDFNVTQGTVSRVVHRVRRPADPGPAAPSTNNGRKLTQAQVDQIRCRVAAGETHQAVAADHNVTREAISRIAQGRNWKGEGVEPIRRYRLAQEQKLEVVRRVLQGERQADVAAEFKISQQSVSAWYARFAADLRRQGKGLD